uniref:Uncharacterized protein n=1 Tax=Tanacetum cinerariifolium TaxID=118510 RepID=A0A6L2N325_TANCI|nr:hypothetical protein [Tanacetum cinerariifolium]
MEDTILELVEICRQKELYCMHDNVDDLIESALNFKLLSINSQHLNKEKQEVKNGVEQPAERRTRIVESLQNFRVIHKSSISLNNTSKISSVHAVAPILSTKEPEYSPSMGYEHPNTTSETESDEITKSGVEELYVEASLPDREIVSVEEENDVNVEEEEERLINVVKNDISDDSTNDPLLEEANLFLASDNSIPPDAEFDFELDAGEEISVVMNDELEYLDPGDEFDDDDYSSFMFVIYSKVFSFLLSAKSEDTIFDPVTPNFPITDSLIMENEHLDTIPETESDEFIKSSVENLVSIPSESEDFTDIESECDMPDCDDSQTTKFSTEFNPIHNEDLDSTPKNDRFDTKSYLLVSLLNRDESIPSGIDNDDSDSERDNLFLERLFHDDPIPLPDTLDFSYDVRVFPLLYLSGDFFNSSLLWE